MTKVVNIDSLIDFLKEVKKKRKIKEVEIGFDRRSKSKCWIWFIRSNHQDEYRVSLKSYTQMMMDKIQTKLRSKL